MFPLICVEFSLCLICKWGSCPNSVGCEPDPQDNEMLLSPQSIKDPRSTFLSQPTSSLTPHIQFILCDPASWVSSFQAPPGCRLGPSSHLYFERLVRWWEMGAVGSSDYEGPLGTWDSSEGNRNYFKTQSWGVPGCDLLFMSPSCLHSFGQRATVGSRDLFWKGQGWY